MQRRLSQLGSVTERVEPMKPRVESNFKYADDFIVIEDVAEGTL